MTNIKENTKQNDVHSHIDKAFKIIDEYLPGTYVNKVQTVLGETHPEITAGMIRNVRHRISEYPISRIEIVNALVEVALNHKSELEKLKKITA